jgi:hypothetical protein
MGLPVFRGFLEQNLVFYFAVSRNPSRRFPSRISNGLPDFRYEKFFKTAILVFRIAASLYHQPEAGVRKSFLIFCTPVS